MTNNAGTDNTILSNDLESILKQRRHRLAAMNERLAQYKQRNQLLVEKEKTLDRLAQEKYDQEQRQKEDKDRLEKERQELYAELQRQQAAAQQTTPQPRSSPATTLPPSTSPALSSSQHQQPTSFPSHTGNFGKVSEQEAIAWLKQQW